MIFFTKSTGVEKKSSRLTIKRSYEVLVSASGRFLFLLSSQDRSIEVSQSCLEPNMSHKVLVTEESRPSKNIFMLNFICD